ncbi:MAG TPA: lantibiotic dehydratase C-terminal domain-containing protein [Thermoanaerobaculia bacterium]|jgi:hypothetical protein|nr:lantibiotic dehydratase C-terminal domain-containing protein [Thermoanaerobaculia bacterium]
MQQTPQNNWLSYHLYYHESLTWAVVGFVHPAIVALRKADLMDGFFFVLYSLGGPHIRLRVRPLPGCGEAIEKTVREAAAEFLARSPSTAALNEEALRKTTESILAKDPHETDGTIHPDNTFIASPFRPEVARYGGPDLLSHSLDFFTVSSIAALDFLTRFRKEPRSRQLILALRLLLRQALGFAADPDELIALLDYGVQSWGEAVPAILEKGDRVFASHRDALCQLFSQGVFDLSSGAPADGASACLGEAARRLSLTVGRDSRRRSIGISQLHMTATRLGLSNPEEAYISRLLSSSAHSIVADEPGTWTKLSEVLTASLSSAEPALPPGAFLPRAFALLDGG